MYYNVTLLWLMHSICIQHDMVRERCSIDFLTIIIVNQTLLSEYQIISLNEMCLHGESSKLCLILYVTWNKCCINNVCIQTCTQQQKQQSGTRRKLNPYMQCTITVFIAYNHSIRDSYLFNKISTIILILISTRTVWAMLSNCIYSFTTI